MQGLHFCFGVGATIAPLLVRLFIPMNIMRVYWVIALCHLMCASIMLGTHVSKSFIEEKVENEDVAKTLLPSSQEHVSKRATFGRRELGFVILMSLFIMCYVGQEVGVGALLYSFGRLSHFHMSPSGCSYVDNIVLAIVYDRTFCCDLCK